MLYPFLDAARRMRVFFLLPVILLAPALRGQQRDIDRLLRRAVSMQKNDTAKVGALVRLARSLKVRDAAQAGMCGEEALRIAESIGHRKGIVAALNALGDVALERRSSDTAGVLFDKAVKLAEESEDSRGMADALSGARQARMTPLPLDADRTELRRLEMLFRRLKDRRGEARALRLTAEHHLSWKNAAEALVWYGNAEKIWNRMRDAWEIADLAQGRMMAYDNILPPAIDSVRAVAERTIALAQRIGHKKAAAIAWAFLGLCNLESDRRAEAVPSAIRGLEIAEKLGDDDALAQVASILGQIHSTMGDDSTAYAWFTRSVKAAERSGSERRLALILRPLGAWYSAHGEWNRALEIYARVKRLLERTGNRCEVAEARKSIADILAESGEHAKAREEYRGSLEVLETLVDGRSAISVLIAMGSDLCNASSFEEAEPLFERALKLSERMRYTAGSVLALNQLATAARARGEKEKSLRYREQGMAILDEAGDRLTSARIRVELGSMYILERAYDKAEALALRGIKDLEELGKDKEVGQFLTLLGTVHESRGMYTRAIREFQEALRLGEQADDPLGQVRALEGLSDLYEILALLDSAAIHADRGLHIARENTLEAYRGQFLLTKSRLLSRRGNFADAITAVQEALTIFEAIDLPTGRVDALNELAFLHIFKKGQPEKALELSRRSLSIAEESDYPQGIASALFLLGEGHAALGHRMEALDHLSRSLAMDRENGEFMRIFYSMTAIANVHEENGDTIRARHFLQEALSLLRNSGEQRETSRTLLSLAHGLLARGLMRQAELLLHQALETAEKNRSRDDYPRIHAALSDLFEALGENGRALAEYKQSIAAKDSIFGEKQMHTIAELNAKYEADKREKKISLLEKDKILDSLELRRRAEQIRLRELEALGHRQTAEILRHERDIRILEIAKTSAELGKQKALNEKRNKDFALLSAEKDLQSSILSRERYARNSILAGLLAAALVTLLGYRNIQNKRRASALRAESAEYKAQAAEAQALALLVETEYKEREAQQAFTRRMIESQEHERRRIAADLHDHLGQGLLVIRNSALLALQDEKVDAKTRRYIEKITETATDTLGDVRQISRDLRPVQLEKFGLTEAIASMLETVGETTPIRFAVEMENMDGRFAREKEINVFRLVQESVNNVIKHSGAAEARVKIRASGDQVLIEVVDNGRGMSRGMLGNPSAAGFGIHGMMERARILGGEIAFDSRAGKGTHVRITLPIQEIAA